MDREYISTWLTFLAPENGGRSIPLSGEASGGSYMPHIVIGDPDQRVAVSDPQNGRLLEEYLGVVFVEGPDVDLYPVGEFWGFCYICHCPS